MTRSTCLLPKLLRLDPTVWPSIMATHSPCRTRPLHGLAPGATSPRCHQPTRRTDVELSRGLWKGNVLVIVNSVWGMLEHLST